VKRAGGLLGGRGCRSGRQLVHGLRPIAPRAGREPNSVSWARGISDSAPQLGTQYSLSGQSIRHIVAIDPVGIAAHRHTLERQQLLLEADPGARMPVRSPVLPITR